MLASTGRLGVTTVDHAAPSRPSDPAVLKDIRQTPLTCIPVEKAVSALRRVVEQRVGPAKFNSSL